MCTANNVHNACFVNSDRAGWDIFNKSKNKESPKIFCTENSLMVSVTMGVHNSICLKQNKNELNIDLKNLEELAMDRSSWRSNFQTTLKVGIKYNQCLK